MKNNLIQGVFINRINRFIAEVEIEEIIKEVHVANTGRCKELLIPGVKVLLKQSANLKRKTRYTLNYVRNKDVWVNLISVSANMAVYNSMIDGDIETLINPKNIIKEFNVPGARFDFFCHIDNQEVYIEVKSVTLIKDNYLQFPDAPTTRGVKHLEHLIDLRNNGKRAILIFVCQHPLGKKFKTNIENDPIFSSKLIEARDNGVEILAYMATDEIGILKLTHPIPILLT